MFRTTIPPGENRDKISLSDKVICIGSCFADMVGHKLEEHKFNADVNPYGIVFNPDSIFTLLDYSISNRFPPAHTYLKNQGMFYNYNLHSHFWGVDGQQLKEKVEKAIQSTARGLPETNWLILTFGTSIIYQRADNGETVANCHKMPAGLFNKRLLTEEEIKNNFGLVMDKIKSVNPNINIILTVSPVRHIKEGLELNAVSKSILRVACHQLAESFTNVNYFPAYEIMMDDLRDYRFYKGDMVHPSEVAEDYIWGIFSQNYFSPDVRAFIEMWRKIRKSLDHRPFHPQSANHRGFLKKLLVQLQAISDTVDVNAEIEGVERQLKAYN